MREAVVSKVVVTNQVVSDILAQDKFLLSKPIWQEKPTNTNFLEASLALPVKGYLAVNLLLTYQREQRCPKFSFNIFYYHNRIFAFDADCAGNTHRNPDKTRVKHPHLHRWRDDTIAWAVECDHIDQSDITECWGFFCDQAKIVNGMALFEHPAFDSNGQMRFL